MPIFSKSRGVRYAFKPWPLRFSTMAPSMQEPVELYRNLVPGSWATGVEK